MLMNSIGVFWLIIDIRCNSIIDLVLNDDIIVVLFICVFCSVCLSIVVVL